MNAKLKIELLSNTCIALGSSFGETTDMDVYLDKDNKPYIPSKRIKGLIRSAIEEYNSLTNNSIDINKILGSPTINENSISKGIGGTLFIEDAYLVKNGSISTKTQTAIDDTTYQAKAGSLRTIKVVNVGALFSSNLILDESDFNILLKVLPLFRHMGLNRNRGLGLVKVTIEKNNLQQVKKNIDIKSKLLKIEIENISNLMISSTNQNETLSYIPSSTILGYFANKYIEKTHDEEKLKDLFLNENHLLFSNGYISDEEYNEYMPCPNFIKKYKNLAESGKDEYVNKFFKDTSNNINERKISSLDTKYVKSNIFDNGLDINNLKVIEPEYEFAYHHSLDSHNKVKTFYQYLSLEKGQHFVAYVYGDISKLKELFEVVNNDIAFFGKSRNSQYGKCKLSFKSIEEKKYEGNVLIFKAPIVLNIDNQDLLEANDISHHIQKDLKVSNYSLKYTNLGGFNMLWGLPKIAKTAIDGGSYIEFENIDSSSIVNFLNNCNVSKLDYMLVDSKNIHSIEKENIVNNKNVQFNTKKENKVLVTALNKYKENKNKNYLNQTQIERLLSLLNETDSLKVFNEEISKIADDKKRKNIQNVLNKVSNCYDNSNYKEFLKTYLTLLKWEGRQNESNKK